MELPHYKWIDTNHFRIISVSTVQIMMRISVIGNTAVSKIKLNLQSHTTIEYIVIPNKRHNFCKSPRSFAFFVFLAMVLSTFMFSFLGSHVYCINFIAQYDAK